MDFIGQNDATQFQHTHRNELLKYLNAEIARSEASPDCGAGRRLLMRVVRSILILIRNPGELGNPQ